MKSSINIDPAIWRAAKLTSIEQALTLGEFLRNAIIREFCRHRGLIAVYNSEREGPLVTRAPGKITEADWRDLRSLRIREEAEERAKQELQKLREAREEFLRATKSQQGKANEQAACRTRGVARGRRRKIS